MLPRLAARRERWPLKRPFRISRGQKTEAEVVVAEISRGGAVGVGECVPYARYGESVESVLDEIAALASAVAAGLTRAELAETHEPGAARNAVDCALWDLEAREAGRSVASLIGAPLPERFVTAVTVGLDRPERMAAEAARLRRVPLLKVKVNDAEPMAALAAVRAAAPEPALIVDPN
jgi:L-alanine-DL-glutamate epimerase-like enolase superfamily enzyme